MANLEELLLKITDVKTLTESQSNETLRTVLEPEVRSFVKESLEKKEYVMKEDDNADYEEEVVDSGDGMDVSMEPEAAPEMGDDMSPKMGDDMDSEELPADLSPSTAEDEEVLDLTDASLEEVMEKLKNLPDDTVIEIVKNPPTYGVSSSSGLNEEEEICEGCDDEMYEGYGRKHMEEEMGEKVEFDVPEWALPALINGDFSGLDDDEEQKLEKFISHVSDFYGNVNFYMDDEEKASKGFKHKNDIDNLGSKVFEVFVFANNSYLNNNQDSTDADEIDEWIEEALQESANDRKVNEYKAIVEQYENKLRKMQERHLSEVKAMNEQLTLQRRKVKQLSEERQKYNKALTESHQLLDQLAVHNTNLLHITKLFTEQTVNRNEKIEIAKQFDNVKTVNESKILFEALSKTLPKKSSTAENAVQLKEQMTTVKATNDNRVNLKEEKTFNDPALERFNELIKYKI